MEYLLYVTATQPVISDFVAYFESLIVAMKYMINECLDHVDYRFSEVLLQINSNELKLLSEMPGFRDWLVKWFKHMLSTSDSLNEYTPFTRLLFTRLNAELTILDDLLVRVPELSKLGGVSSLKSIVQREAMSNLRIHLCGPGKYILPLLSNCCNCK